MRNKKAILKFARRVLSPATAYLWGLLFVAGAVLGYVFWRDMLGGLVPYFKVGMRVSRFLKTNGAASFATVLAIFLKNFSVAFLCAALGKPTKFVFPAFVCLVNGSTLGAVGGLLAHTGTALWRFCAALAPHGVFELPGLFIACASGARGFRFSGLKLPVVLLLVAAAVETWVSPAVAHALL